ncbi:MAG: LL-diaminopimelate aminotransferase [Phycisphaerae bacterium]|nr:LL-diaminopimelate aminotransferase [Phycisphaerae bacterium]
MQRAARLDALPPYLFVEIDRRKRAAIEAGKDVINLGVGDPDRPTPGFIVERMQAAVADPKNHRYPFDEGVPAFRQEAARWFSQRFGVELDWRTEVLTLIGSKEGIGHLPLGVVNPGDYVLVPQPGYPVYQSATLLAGASPFVMDLTETRNWLPDLAAIPADVCKRASLMYLNYPNNPTAAIAPRTFYEEVVAFARQHKMLIAQDAAYSELYFDAKPISILEVPGARDVAIEFHSLSKTFNMTGWRLGFAVGHADAIAALAKVKANMDSGQFNAIQWAGVEAMRRIDDGEIRALRDMYRERRDVLVAGLRKLGLRVRSPEATFYVWAACPEGCDSMSFVTRLLEEADVVTIPGIGFGKAGEGYFRMALTVGSDRIREALERLAKVKW